MEYTHIHSVLISGPAVGAAQNPVSSYSSAFLPPMSAISELVCFLFWGALNDLLYIPQTQSLLS